MLRQISLSKGSDSPWNEELRELLEERLGEDWIKLKYQVNHAYGFYTNEIIIIDWTLEAFSDQQPQKENKEQMRQTGFYLNI